jgi:putative transposase
MQAREQWRETSDKLRDRFPKLAALMDDAEDDVLAFMAFPKAHWPQLASTNPLERLNKEIKRRSRVIGIFPNDAAVIRLVGALLEE